MVKEGQALWWVPVYSRDKPKEVTVKKVGRKWVELSNRIRIDKQTLIADGKGYASPGRCYLSEAEYVAYRNRQHAWSQLVDDLRWRKVPDGVTVDDINAARKLLRPPHD